jgi:nicotinamide mononucleotide transporter
LTLHDLLVGFAAVTGIEWTAVVLALGYVLLAIRQNPWCWSFAIASSALYTVVFARGGLLMQAMLQVFYIAMALYGWRAWRGTATVAPLAIGRMPLRWHALAITTIAAVAALHAVLLGDPALGRLVPYADSCIAWGSVFATLLETRKILENWLYWVVLDAAAAVLYASQGLLATAVLFVLYSALAIRGYVRWHSDATMGSAASA